MLQPRVTPSLPMGREGSLFQRIFSGPGGLDPYAFAVSDVYQDLFGQGSYTGKGIYDVDVFEAALAGRVPESTLLSHDLLEGIFAGAGLVSDVEVVEEHPARYDVAAARQHRWARGDWQLLPWIFGRGRDSSGSPERRAIPWIGRWKMLDNLRRSLSAPAAFAALVAGWTLPLASPGVWSAFVVATLATPAFLPFFLGLVPRRLGISKRSHLLAVGADLGLALRQVGLPGDPAGAPGLADDRRHRAYAVAPASRVAACSSGSPPRSRASARDSDLLRLLPPHGGRRRAGRGGRDRARAGRSAERGWSPAPFLIAWLLSPGDRALGQPRAVARRHRARQCRRRACAARCRASHLAILRDLRHARRSHAPAGQLPGRSRAGAWRTGRRRRTWASTCFRRWPRATSAGSARSTPSSGSRRRSRR